MRDQPKEDTRPAQPTILASPPLRDSVQGVRFITGSPEIQTQISQMRVYTPTALHSSVFDPTRHTRPTTVVVAAQSFQFATQPVPRDMTVAYCFVCVLIPKHKAHPVHVQIVKKLDTACAASFQHVVSKEGELGQLRVDFDKYFPNGRHVHITSLHLCSREAALEDKRPAKQFPPHPSTRNEKGSASPCASTCTPGEPSLFAIARLCGLHLLLVCTACFQLS